MLGIKPNRIPDPDDPSKRIMDYWGPSQRMLGDPEFINQLKNYDKDSIPVKVITATAATTSNSNNSSNDNDNQDTFTQYAVDIKHTACK
jgi:hypothetical protein